MNTTDAAQDFWEKRWANVEHKPNEFEIAKAKQIERGFPDAAKTVLDVGCGTCWMLESLRSKWDYAVGADYTIEGLKRAKLPRVQASGFALPFRDDSFDLILCAEVIEHLNDEDLARLLRELFRVSSKYLLITTPYRERRELGMIKCDLCLTKFHTSLHLRVWTEDLLESTFAKEGFKPVWIETTGKRRFRSNLISSLNGYLTGYYAAEPRVCPVCGNTRIPLPRARDNPISMILESLNLTLGRVVPGRAYSLCGLFEKTD